MPVTELSMGPPLHRTPTIRRSRFWRCVIEEQDPVVQSSVRLPGTYCPNPYGAVESRLGNPCACRYTVGRLLRFTVRLSLLPDLVKYRGHEHAGAGLPCA